jgi:spore coat protein H
MLATKIVNDKLDFTWEPAYDLNNEDITYELTLGTDWEFKNIIAKQTVKNITELQLEELKPGTYFWRLTATNASGHTQLPYNYYEDANSINHYGVRYLYITPDGTILEK